MQEIHAVPSPSKACELPKSFSSLEKLLDFLMLDPKSAPWELDFAPNFKFLVPKAYAEKIKKKNWQDPLLRQILPLKMETWHQKGFVKDAVGDKSAEVHPGVIHKYKSRILLMPSSACALHCRYCFRREFDYPKKQLNINWDWLSQYLKEHPDVDEIILSGGDPLMAPNNRLAELTKTLLTYSQIQTLRIHTRVPISLPERFDEGLLNIFQTWSETFSSLVLVHHINHEAELNGRDTVQLLEKLRSFNLLQLNQSVLLKDVNDTAETLEKLSKRLVRFGILPYYLHQLDKVEGCSHFEVPVEKGQRLVEDLRENMSGYEVPRYVQEISGEHYKRPL